MGRLYGEGSMNRRSLVRRAVLVSTAVALSAGAWTVSGQERGRGRGGPVTLPEGPGKAIVEERCGSCHSLGLISNSGYTREEWVSLFSTMVALPRDQEATVADYLAAHFPEKP